ncbi:SRPBCC family protein [Lolliginicoccus suaedae]|uniref:SRPBCC family protein n=1 Tax=Lolliginicoccus suaedae TaxID=2605429 RepID=UPI0011EF6BCC|nr:SRPBCC family protein [Lolliginicoccus suaedae]
MAVSGSIDFEIKASPEKVMAALVDVESLPKWSSSHRKVEVRSRDEQGRPQRVWMAISTLGINDEQLVDYRFTDDTVEWSLVEPSNQQKTQDGSYVLSPSAAGTRLTFELTVDLKIPMPGFLVKRGQKMALETASKGLTKFVEGQD